jgi:phosphoribosylformimino-5-aminoimidazole carboxamide ribotide isomerase
MITVIPAIDLKDGQCVRLRQGRTEDKTVYGSDPAAMAGHWRAAGARWLHVVDLDGAFLGRPVHSDQIAAIVKAMGPIPVEVGGGIREEAHIEHLLELGVRRVVVGTRACTDPDRTAGWIARYGDRLAVGIDARDGKVQVRGWVETTDMSAIALGRRLSDAGLRTLIYTDTATDGMLSGPNLAAIEALSRSVACEVIASGGVAEPAHVRQLRALGCPNLVGVIVGKALYEGRADLAAFQEAGD